MGLIDFFTQTVKNAGKAISTHLHGTPKERAFIALEAEEQRLLKLGQRPENTPSFQKLERAYLVQEQEELQARHKLKPH